MFHSLNDAPLHLNGAYPRLTLGRRRDSIETPGCPALNGASEYRSRFPFESKYAGGVGWSNLHVGSRFTFEAKYAGGVKRETRGQMEFLTGQMKQRSPKNNFNTGSNEMLDRSNEMLDRSNEMLDRSNEMLDRSNEMLDRSMKCWTGPMKC
ncbi:hypothetical protein TNCV_3655121 [Trichonephila clavipes]|nr:hypothetical protein TNCV_3655121 [Trichonephila clavipes]